MLCLPDVTQISQALISLLYLNTVNDQKLKLCGIGLGTSLYIILMSECRKYNHSGDTYTILRVSTHINPAIT